MVSPTLRPSISFCTPCSRRIPSWATVLVAACLGGLSAGEAQAQAVIFTWDGGASTSNWFDAANWSSDTLPGTTQSGSTTVNQALIPNTSGTINYTPGSPTSFDYLNITKSDTTSQLTINLNGNLTTLHAQGAAYASVGDAIGGGGNLVFNVKSGTYSIRNNAFTFNGNQFTIDSGASVVTQDNSIQSNRPTVVTSGTLTVRGTLTNFPGFGSGTTAAIIRGAGVVLNRGDVVVDGGTANLNNISFHNTASFSDTRTFSVMNNGNAVVYFGQGSTIGGNVSNTTGYDNRISVSSGTFVNNDTLRVGSVNAAGATRPGTGRVTVSGGAFNQNGALYIGDGRVGIVDISGASTMFTSPGDVFVGGGRTSTDAAPTTGATTSGTLTISSGTVTISNPNAGTVYTTTLSQLTNPGSNTHIFGTASNTWDNEYTGQRVVFNSLSGLGSGLATATVYYTMDPNTVAFDARRSFGVAATSGGAGITGATYTGATYRTLAARLLVGNTMTFSGTSFVVPGTLNISGGRLVADEFVANQGANSTINFTGGSFRINQSSDVNTGSQLQVGNGTLAAVLDIAGGTNSFAQGLRINNNATLMGSGTISAGTVTIASGGVHSPGNSPGIQTVANETWQSGGTYLWEINNWNGTAGTNFDRIVATGTLDVQATNASTFTIQIAGLTGSNTVGAVPGFVDTARKDFTIATSGSLANFAADKFSLASSGSFSPSNSLGNGGFAIGNSGNDVVLSFIPSAVYDVSAAASNATIIVGGSSTITAALINNTTGRTNPDSVTYSGLGVGNGVVLGSTSGTGIVAGGTSTTMGVFTTVTAGTYSFGPSVTAATNSTLGTAALAGGTTSATVTVLDHALPGFLAAGISNAYTQDVLNINFGSIDESAGVQNFTYNLLNLASQASGAGLTAGLDFTGVTADGSGFSSGLSTFSNLFAGGTSSQFTLSFAPSGQGTFSKAFTLSFSDNQSLSGASARRDLTINAQVIVVPEPTSMALAGIGIAATAWALRRRRA